MPAITVNPGQTSFTYQLTGLDPNYNQEPYRRTAYWQIICTSGQSYSFTGTEVLRSNITAGEVNTCDPQGSPMEEYLVQCTVYSPYDSGGTPVSYFADGVILWRGDVYVTLLPEELEMYEWDTPKVQGQPFLLTAAEWNRLSHSVSNVRYRATGTWVNIDPVVQGNSVTASDYNIIRLNLIVSAQNYPAAQTQIPLAATGQPITAYALNQLRGAHNALVVVLNQ